MAGRCRIRPRGSVARCLWPPGHNGSGRAGRPGASPLLRVTGGCRSLSIRSGASSAAPVRLLGARWLELASGIRVSPVAVGWGRDANNKRINPTR